MTQNVLTITEANLDALLKTQNEILQLLQLQHNHFSNVSQVTYEATKEFMDTVRIRHTKFDQLAAEGKIRIVQKKRKIYFPAGEVNRFFTDARIE